MLIHLTNTQESLWDMHVTLNSTHVFQRHWEMKFRSDPIQKLYVIGSGKESEKWEEQVRSPYLHIQMALKAHHKSFAARLPSLPRQEWHGDSPRGANLYVTRRGGDMESS